MSEPTSQTPTVGETLAPGARPHRDAKPPSAQVSASATALALARKVGTGRGAPLVHLASSERRAEEIGRALAGFSPTLEVLVLPPWDCLPYDRASPSRDVMGRRMRVLQQLAQSRAVRVLITSPEALVQKLPPQTTVAEAFIDLERGQVLDREALAAFAAAAGYVVDDRIDEPGEIAFLGEVVDVFPADAARPVRIVIDQDRIGEMRTYDPLTQRSEGELEILHLGPASELILGPGPDGASPERAPGAEHAMAQHYGALVSLFDLLPKARLSTDAKALARLAEVEDHVLDAFEARRSLGGGLDPASPDALNVLGPALEAAMAGWSNARLEVEGFEPIANLALQRNPGRAFCDLVEAHRRAHRRIVLTGLRQELRPLARALARGLDLKPTPVADWSAATSAERGAVVSVELDTGFVEPASDLVVIAASDVAGGRTAARATTSVQDLLAEPDLRPGDVVLHEDHGVGVLRELARIDIDGVARDTLQLEYHGGDILQSPVEEIGRIWRYGAEESAVTLDRLKGDGWAKRRAEVHQHLETAAQQLCPWLRRGKTASASRSPRPRPPTPSSPRASPIPKPPTNRPPSRRCWPIWPLAGPWTAWFVATWALGRPRWPCAPRPP